MRVNVDELMTMWQTAASNPQLREECQKRTDALAKKLAKTGNEKKLKTVAVKLLKAITPQMEATLIAWMSGDMAAKGVRGFEMQSNFYYSIKRLASSIFGEKTDRAHTEIQFCADKLGQVMRQSWQVQEFPSLKQARTWFDQLPPDLLPNLQYFSKNEWLDKACLHRGYQRQMIHAVNASQVTMANLGITSSAALKAFVKLYGRQLTALDLSSCFFVNDRDLDAIISYVPSLQILSLA
ncbi:MAG: hypothetical protein LLG04_05815, partial [Parachlamydia sp.]|nr:hypothetical protein [Parachlamydia sp.]